MRGYFTVSAHTHAPNRPSEVTDQDVLDRISDYDELHAYVAALIQQRDQLRTAARAAADFLEDDGMTEAMALLRALEALGPDDWGDGGARWSVVRRNFSSVLEEDDSEEE